MMRLVQLRRSGTAGVPTERRRSVGGSGAGARAERQSAAGRVRPGARGPGACGPGPTASADPGRTTPEPPPYGRTAREERTAALVDAVRLRLAESGAPPTDGSVAAAVRASRPPLGGGDVLDTVRALRAELVGAGPLDGLLAAPDVTDVLVNGPDEVWIDRGGGLQRVPEVRFADADAVRRLAHRLATAAGRRLDDARPWVDARLPDGTRLHAVLPPIAAGCTHISLRVCRPRPFTLDELVAGGALPPQGAEILACVLRARLSLLISGGTGTGKTTLLAALLGLVGPGERIVLAEDSAELRPDHPHVVRLQSRPPNQEGLGELTLRDLVRQALRMRPDRLVIGEVRGAEVSDLLAALNTGHEGGCGTVHANRAADVPVRLEALGALAGLDRTALHSQLRAALDVVVHVVREPGPGRRRVAEIHVLGGDRTGLAVTTPAVTFTADGSVLPGAGWERLTRLCAERGVELPRIPASREPEDAAPRGAAGFRVGAGPRGCAGFIGGAGCAGGGKFTGGGTGFGGARFGGGGPGRGGDGPGTRGGPR